MLTKNNVSTLAQTLGMPESDAINYAVAACQLMLQHTDMLAGDILQFIQHGEWPMSANKLLVPGEPTTENVLMGMRVLIYKLRKYEGPDGKAQQMYEMMRRLGYFKMTDALR